MLINEDLTKVVLLDAGQIGVANVRGKSLGAQGWGRLPARERLVAKAGADGAQVWIKGAPLRHADILPMPL